MTEAVRVLALIIKAEDTWQWKAAAILRRTSIMMQARRRILNLDEKAYLTQR